MTEPTAQKLTELAREFVERLRATLTQAVHQGVTDEPDKLVERALSIGATLVAAILMVAKADKRSEAIVVALLSAALRRFASRKEVVLRG